MAKKYYQTFVVETDFQFPLDMLRYNRCFPDTEATAGLITANLTEGLSPIRVIIGRYVETKKATPPTVARWKSFGCRVDDIEVR